MPPSLSQLEVLPQPPSRHLVSERIIRALRRSSVHFITLLFKCVASCRPSPRCPSRLRHPQLAPLPLRLGRRPLADHRPAHAPGAPGSGCHLHATQLGGTSMFRRGFPSPRVSKHYGMSIKYITQPRAKRSRQDRMAVASFFKDLSYITAITKKYEQHVLAPVLLSNPDHKHGVHIDI